MTSAWQRGVHVGHRPGGIGLATVAASVVAVLAGCASGPTRHIAAPATDAPPAAVVRVYVAALNAHDAQTVHRLSYSVESVAWLDDVDHISNLQVTGVHVEKPQWSGQPVGSDVRNVAVRFDVDWGLFSDGSLEDGSTIWGYLLKRDHTSGRWTIFDEGTG